MDLKEAQHELIRSCRAWGVDPNRRDHVQFQKRALSAVMDCFDNVTSSERSSPQVLSNDIEVAVRTVFCSEISGCGEDESNFRIIRDKIRSSSSLSPYFVAPDKYQPRKWYPRLRREFEKVPKAQLDPLTRFRVEKISKKDLFLDQWVFDSSSPEQGHVMEAIVASHAIHGEACYYCKCRNSLRWNGGPNGAWTDMECIACDSAFEIKSKRDMEAIDRNEVNNFPGGSFRAYHMLHHQRRKPGWKHYFVVASRLKSFSTLPGHGPELQACRTVQISEIEKVFPRLRSSSFVSPVKGNIIPMVSEIVIKGSLVNWFKIPYELIEYGPIMFGVLEEFFPGVNKEIAEICHEEDEQPKKHDVEVTKEVKDPTDRVNEIREALADLNTDCWDESESD